MVLDAENSKNPSRHGGKRPGAGRKRKITAEVVKSSAEPGASLIMRRGRLVLRVEVDLVDAIKAAASDKLRARAEELTRRGLPDAEINVTLSAYHDELLEDAKTKIARAYEGAN